MPLSEPCVLYILRLVKHKPTLPKPLLGATFSFTAFLRPWRSLDGWRREITRYVETNLVVEHGPMLEGALQFNEALKTGLFGPADAKHMLKPNQKADEQELKRFMKHAVEVCRLLDVGEERRQLLVHRPPLRCRGQP